MGHFLIFIDSPSVLDGSDEVRMSFKIIRVKHSLCIPKSIPLDVDVILSYLTDSSQVTSSVTHTLSYLEILKYHYRLTFARFCGSCNNGRSRAPIRIYFRNCHIPWCFHQSIPKHLGTPPHSGGKWGGRSNSYLELGPSDVYTKPEERDNAHLAIHEVVRVV